eukprot:TRINITY_DN14100_c0_g1_i2.p1 TRINITY_DN14100_c0_g1~~TRINITY_DN14100_c0_g1_i2.p1  ORF type:complete len:337 (+),score=84.11 TRINITY_DN14100_c0_g1_i2:61-1071(+)
MATRSQNASRQGSSSASSATAAESAAQDLLKEVERLKLRLSQTEALLAPVEQIRGELNAQKKLVKKRDHEIHSLNDTNSKLLAKVAELEASEASWRQQAEMWNARTNSLEGECAALACQEGHARGALLQAQERESGLEMHFMHQSKAFELVQSEQFQAQSSAEQLVLDLQGLQRAFDSQAQDHANLTVSLRMERTDAAALRSELRRVHEELKTTGDDALRHAEALQDEAERAARLLSKNENIELELHTARMALLKQMPAPVSPSMPPGRVSVSGAGTGVSGVSDTTLLPGSGGLLPASPRRQNVEPDKNLMPTRHDYPRSAHSRGLRNGVLQVAGW